MLSNASNCIVFPPAASLFYFICKPSSGKWIASMMLSLSGCLRKCCCSLWGRGRLTCTLANSPRDKCAGSCFCRHAHAHNGQACVLPVHLVSSHFIPWAYSAGTSGPKVFGLNKESACFEDWLNTHTCTYTHRNTIRYKPHSPRGVFQKKMTC